jgi:hypothetical protein
VSVDKTKGRFLARQMNKDARQDGVLEDVGEIAGVKGVAVIDLKNPLPAELKPPARLGSPGSAAKDLQPGPSGIFHLTGATAIEPRWQLWRATLRQIA